MQTAVVYTLQDQSAPNSRMIALFGNPAEYAWRLGNFSAFSTNPVSYRYLTSTFYDRFHAVVVDSQRKRVYYGDNRLGVIAYRNFISDNTTQYSSFLAPPITKQVIFIVDITVYRTWYRPTECICFVWCTYTGAIRIKSMYILPNFKRNSNRRALIEAKSRHARASVHSTLVCGTYRQRRKHFYTSRH